MKLGSFWLAVCLLSITSALADEDLVHLIAPSEAKQQLSSFSVKSMVVPIQTEEVDHEAKLFVTVSGNYGHDDWNLIEGSKKISPAANGDFQFKFYISDQNQMMDMMAISPKGKVEKEKIAIYVDNWAQIQEKLHPAPPVPKSYSLIPSLGFSYINYNQSPGVSPLSETLLTVKISYQRKIFKDNPLWDIGLSGFFTALPLTTNNPGNYLQYLGLNARVGYQFQPIRDPWKLVLFGGFYYATSFSTVSGPINFGYENLIGWQLYPTLSYTFKNQNVASVYFKFSPINDEQAIISTLSNHEIAAGGAYGFYLKNAHTLSVSADFADLYLNSAASGQIITSLSATLSVGYSL